MRSLIWNPWVPMELIVSLWIGFPVGTYQTPGIVMSIGTIVLIILVLALLGGFSGLGGGPFYGTGYYGGGGLGLVIVILLILVLLGKL